MKHRKYAFTLVELLVVISIIALLLGLVIPATNHVMKAGRVAAMKATIHSVSVGVEQFKTDKGSYPVSGARFDGSNAYSIQLKPFGMTYASEKDTRYCDVGTHHLAEAMFGLDKLGYSPAQIPGPGYSAQDRFYRIDDLSGEPLDPYNNPIKRSDIYVDPSKLEVGTLPNDVYQAAMNVKDFNPSVNTAVWDNPNPVILDKSNRKSPTPVLYFKANKRANIMTGVDPDVIYNYGDNGDILDPYRFLFDLYTYNSNFLNQESGPRSWPQYIWDPKTGIGNNEAARFSSPARRPYNSDTFLLISGGPDGRFGTDDDITNFQRRE